jgi:hypothetical protein
MTLFSRGRTLVAGIAIILIVNAIALAGVAYNRSGSPDSTLLLSQRELGEPSAWRQDNENSGIALTLKWRVPVQFDETEDLDWRQGFFGAFGQSPAWLDAAKLRSLGFDTRPPVSVADASQDDRPQPRREVLLVLELDGPAYQQSLAQTRRLLAHARTDIDAAKHVLLSEERENSRLFVVDAGRDGEALRARYPDRSHYAIVRGTIRPQWTMRGAKRLLVGNIVQLSVDSINVPVAFREIFASKAGKVQTGDAPRNVHRFEAVVAFGKRFEPWIVKVSGQR